MNMNFDDIFYPMYLEYYNHREGFYDRHIDEIKTIFKNISDNGSFCFKYTTAENGDKCYAENVVYKGRLIKNSVGYRSKDVALMAIIDAIRKGYFENIWR